MEREPFFRKMPVGYYSLLMGVAVMVASMEWAKGSSFTYLENVGIYMVIFGLLHVAMCAVVYFWPVGNTKP